MTFYIPWLVDAARLTGYPVIDVPGRASRGHGGMRVVEVVTDHHTANPNRANYPSLGIVRDGRADLAGPLAHLGLARDGTIYVIASGLCYHAGASRWAGFNDLNDEAIGIEAESAGTYDDWTSAQKDCYPRLNAALLYYMHRGADRLCGHKECCLPAGRKIDPGFTNMQAVRDKVAWLLGDPLHRIPRFANPTTVEVTPIGSHRRRNEDNNVELPVATTRRDYQVPTDVVGGWCGGAEFMLTANTDGNAKSAKVFGIYAVIWRGGTPPDVRELQKNDAGAAFAQWWPWKGALPKGTTSIIVSYIAPQGMVARVEYEH